MFFLASRADPQEKTGGQCRGQMACAPQSATAGAPSSSKVGIWSCRAPTAVMERDFCLADMFMPTRLLPRVYIHAAKATLALSTHLEMSLFCEEQYDFVFSWLVPLFSMPYISILIPLAYHSVLAGPIGQLT